jgi:hypothetical protein
MAYTTRRGSRSAHAELIRRSPCSMAHRWSYHPMHPHSSLEYGSSRTLPRACPSEVDPRQQLDPLAAAPSGAWARAVRGPEPPEDLRGSVRLARCCAGRVWPPQKSKWASASTRELATIVAHLRAVLSSRAPPSSQRGTRRPVLYSVPVPIFRPERRLAGFETLGRGRGHI